jgi:hypothetical protein
VFDWNILVAQHLSDWASSPVLLGLFLAQRVFAPETDRVGVMG